MKSYPAVVCSNTLHDKRTHKGTQSSNDDCVPAYRSLWHLIHTTSTVNAKNLASLDRDGSFACEVKYLTSIVYGRLALTIFRLK